MPMEDLRERDVTWGQRSYTPCCVVFPFVDIICDNIKCSSRHETLKRQGWTGGVCWMLSLCIALQWTYKVSVKWWNECLVKCEETWGDTESDDSFETWCFFEEYFLMGVRPCSLAVWGGICCHCLLKMDTAGSSHTAALMTLILRP